MRLKGWKKRLAGMGSPEWWVESIVGDSAGNERSSHAQIVDEVGVRVNLVGAHPDLLGDDLADAQPDALFERVVGVREVVGLGEQHTPRQIAQAGVDRGEEDVAAAAEGVEVF